MMMVGLFCVCVCFYCRFIDFFVKRAAGYSIFFHEENYCDFAVILPEIHKGSMKIQSTYYYFIFFEEPNFSITSFLLLPKVPSHGYKANYPDGASF